MYWLIFSGYIRQFEHSSRPQWSFVARFRVNMLGPFAGQEFSAWSQQASKSAQGGGVQGEKRGKELTVGTDSANTIQTSV